MPVRRHRRVVRAARDRLLDEVWPIIRSRAPEAVLHLAGPGSETLRVPGCGGVVRRGTVARAGALYDRRSVALVPLRVGSGVRLRLLPSGCYHNLQRDDTFEQEGGVGPADRKIPGMKEKEGGWGFFM